MTRKEFVTAKWVFLPVEVKGRELTTKLFLALTLVKAGFGVFLGRNGMNISRDRFPRGIYFDKCLSTHKVAFHEHQVLQKGNVLVSLDEEGLLFASPEVFCRDRMNPRSVELSSAVFLWGQEEKRAISKIPDPEKFVVTGGPRVDTWRPEFASYFAEESNKLIAEYGNFILIVSNWCFGAHEKAIGREADEVYPDAPWSFVRKKFYPLIRSIATKFPSELIVVRPHPQALLEVWETLEKDRPFPANVMIKPGGSITPWIKASKLVIHNTCTSGIEALVGGIPTVSYTPHEPTGEIYSPYTVPISSFGQQCFSEHQVIEKVRNLLSNPSGSSLEEPKRRLEQFLHLDKDKFSSDLIVEHLRKIDLEEYPYELTQYSFFKKLRSLGATIKFRVRSLLGLTGMYTFRYTQSKNPGIKLSEVEEGLEKLSRNFEISPDLLQVRQVDADTFCIYPEELKGSN